MTDTFQTIEPSQLPVATALSAAARVIAHEPDGPPMQAPLKLLLGKLINVDLLKDTRALLYADLAHVAGTIGFVTDDATAAYNGWYRKTGASGAGAWTQFETLSLEAKAAAQAWAEGTLPGGAGTKSAKEHALDAGAQATAAAASAASIDGKIVNIDCQTPTGSGNNVLLVKEAAFALVDAGIGQIFNFVPIANNSNANGTTTTSATIAGVLGGVSREIVLPGNKILPHHALRTGYPAAITPHAGLNKFVLLSSATPFATFLTTTTMAGSTGDVMNVKLPMAGLRPYDGSGELTASNALMLVQATGSATGAGKTITLYDADGTTVLFGPTQIWEIDGATTPPAGRWQANDWLLLVRQAPGSCRLIMTNPRYPTDAEAVANSKPTLPVTSGNVAAVASSVKDNIARMLSSLDYQLPTIDKPVRIAPIQRGIQVYDIRPRDADYQGVYSGTRMPDDLFRVWMINLAIRYYVAGTIVSGHLLTPMSMEARFNGRWVPWSNFNWNDVVGVSSDNGLIGTAFDPVFFVDKRANEGGTYNTAGSGPHHPNIDCTGFSQTTVGGTRNGALIADGTNIRDILGLNEIVFASQVDLSANWVYETPDGSTAITSNVLHRFGAGDQLTVSTAHTFTSAFPVSVSAGYHLMAGVRAANFVSVRLVNGTLVAPISFAPGAGESINLGQAASVLLGNTNVPGNALKVTTNDAYKPFRRGGVQVGSAPDVVLIRQSYGGKVYWATHDGSLTFDEETGNTISGLAYFRGVRADAA